MEVRTADGHKEVEYLYVVLDRGLIFPSVSYVRHQINKAGMKAGQSKLPLVLDCSHIVEADFTAAKGFKSLIADFKKRNQAIIFYNMSPYVVDTLKGIIIDHFNVATSNEELQDLLRSSGET